MKIIESFGNPLSGMRSLLVEYDNGELEIIHGDWRMIMDIEESQKEE